MKIRKNGKVINLTESDLRRIVKRVMNEGVLREDDSTEGVKYGVKGGLLSEGASHTFNDGKDKIRAIGGWVYVNGEPSCIRSSNYAFGVSNLWKNKQGGLTIQLNDPKGNLDGKNVIKLSKKDVDDLFSDIKNKWEYKTKLAGYDVSLKRGNTRVNWCKKQWS